MPCVPNATRRCACSDAVGAKSANRPSTRAQAATCSRVMRRHSRGAGAHRRGDACRCLAVGGGLRRRPSCFPEVRDAL
eukprot:5386744-Prymnesium_polylepis.1